MSPAFQPGLDFEAADRAAEGGEALVLDLDGFEGPLHLLLALARNQTVDLRRISVARLAEQYLHFVERERRTRFGLAAEYLVMAAWLAYLKSRLLLPKPETQGAGDEPPAEELAEALAFRLAKLEAMRAAAEALRASPQLGRDVFLRGRGGDAPAGTPLQEDLYGLMKAYVAARVRPEPPQYRPAARVEAYGLEAARDRLKAWLSRLGDWTPLQQVAPVPRRREDPSRASYLASTFSAGLEMTRDGALELRQPEPFTHLYLRATRDAPAVTSSPERSGA